MDDGVADASNGLCGEAEGGTGSAASFLTLCMRFGVGRHTEGRFCSAHARCFPLDNLAPISWKRAALDGWSLSVCHYVCVELVPA